MLLPVKPLEMAYPNKKLSFWCKTLTHMKKAKFCRKEKRKRGIFGPVFMPGFSM